MRTILRLSALFAATCLAFVSTSSAQFVNFGTLNTWTGSTVALSAGESYGETITNVVAVKEITYRFVTSASSPITATTIDAAFGEWTSGAPGSLNPLTTFSSIVIPASSDSSWGTVTAGATTFRTYDYTFSVEQLNLTASTTYALLVSPTAATGLSFGQNNFGAASSFANGYVVDTGFETLNKDWAFQSLIYVPNGNFVPVPETSTVAAIFGALLVAGLVAFRLRQRRQQVAPAMAAAA